jgi:hypothetical protein
MRGASKWNGFESRKYKEKNKKYTSLQRILFGLLSFWMGIFWAIPLRIYEMAL